MYNYPLLPKLPAGGTLACAGYNRRDTGSAHAHAPPGGSFGIANATKTMNFACFTVPNNYFTGLYE